jgi:hypothetical protein
MTNEDATNSFFKWIEGMKDERRNNPEAFQEGYRESGSGLFIGGLKFKPGDKIVTDNQGLPQIHRKGCFE